VRVGIAGLGGMGLVHARNVIAEPGLELVTVAAARLGRADEVAAELGGGLRACSYAELFAAEDVDAVVIAARSVDHARLAGEALRAGKHLFLEKPGATSIADHEALRDEAALHPDLVLQVGYHRRYDSAFAEARRLLADGAVGEPLLVLATSRDEQAPEPEDPRPAGGFLVDMAVHDYDVFCWLLGRRPVEVYAARQALVHPELGELDDLDNAVVTVRFEGGVIGATHVSRTCAFGHDIRCEVVGVEGSILIGNAAARDGVTLVRAEDGTRFPRDYRDRFADAYRAELAAFADACRGSGQPGPGIDDDRRAVEIGIAARASAVRGAPLEVGPDWPWP
jgi:predicted dehydrogenase